jgi:Ice-binding-like/Bacterial Ig-like domain
MRKSKFTNVWITAFLLAGLLAGCGDPDANSGAGKPGSPLTPPAVTSVNPLNGSTFTCGNPVVINATFSKAMNPATINTTTFTLATGSTSVAGAVTYAAATNVATFTPSAPLSPNSLYVATITTGAQDQFGNGLTANFFWSFTTSPPCPPPTVTAVTPPNGNVAVCPNTALITATFSHAMNPATINTTTFTLTGPGGASVSGQVSYVVATMIATFTPSATLIANTKYTATITTGAQDTGGIPLAANFVWTFTTSPICGGGAAIPLGAACSFGILGATPVVSSTGPTHVTGDIGIWPAASITGFPPGTFTGAQHLGDAIAMTAQGDLTTAYNLAAGAAGGAALTADIGGQTLPPGVYKATTTLGITGILTLDGSTNPNGVWIFQVGSALTTAAGPGNSQVLLIGGAQAHNVFWQIGSSATLGTFSTFQGTIMAQASITLGTGAVLNGRALARTGAVTMDSNPVNVPPCP